MSTDNVSPPPSPVECAEVRSRSAARSSIWLAFCASAALAVFLVALTPAVPALGQQGSLCSLLSVSVDGTAATKAGDTWSGSAGADSFTVDVSTNGARNLYVYMEPFVNTETSAVAYIKHRSGSFTFDVAAHTAWLRQAPAVVGFWNQNGEWRLYRHADQKVVSSANSSATAREPSADEMARGEASKNAAIRNRRKLATTFPVKFKVNIDLAALTSRCPLVGIAYIVVSDSRTAQVLDLVPQESTSTKSPQLQPSSDGAIQAPPTTTATTTTTTTTTITTTTQKPDQQLQQNSASGNPPPPLPSQQSGATTQAEPADDEEETEDEGVTLADVLQAAKAYKEGDLSLEELQKIIRAYLNS